MGPNEKLILMWIVGGEHGNSLPILSPSKILISTLYNVTKANERQTEDEFLASVDLLIKSGLLIGEQGVNLTIGSEVFLRRDTFNKAKKFLYWHEARARGPGVQGLLQGIQWEIAPHRFRSSPPHDSP